MACSDLVEDVTSAGDVDGNVRLLGFDLALDDILVSPVLKVSFKESARPRCPNGITDWCGRALTIRERAMINMMSDIMEKIDWDRKIFDDAIVAKWRSTAVSEEKNFSEAMFKYVRSRSASILKRQFSLLTWTEHR